MTGEGPLLTSQLQASQMVPFEAEGNNPAPPAFCCSKQGGRGVGTWMGGGGLVGIQKGVRAELGQLIADAMTPAGAVQF